MTSSSLKIGFRLPERMKNERIIKDLAQLCPNICYNAPHRFQAALIRSLRQPENGF
ncbi:hypothetical protein [Kingella sp. (in: b-proteobacteria)]|uniref:hypothetical protein n=1 Tax=Kingella sp. (in: b-proteobacteria) TaxID=2020713 RepID=UPI0026DB6780|nr:hypothetical protein [Kingella sp. (in: b-proteobacteria)]MDO4658596.1 hypothetical protein [Kingella sp. (in: b-proteobacteria)]